MKTLKNRLLLGVNLLLFWVGYFLIARLIFLLYHYSQTSKLGFSTVLKTFTQGIKLDFSISAYILVIPFLILLFSIWLPKKIIKIIIKWYTIPLIFIITFLMMIDVNLYQSWGTRLDSTLLTYINTPTVMMASVSYSALFLGIFIWIIISLFFVYLFNKVNNCSFKNTEKGKIWELPIMLLVIGSLVLLMRGGLQTIPLNQSNVYFSDKMFANHSAINFAWNFMHSVTHESYDKTNPFATLEPEKATRIFNQSRSSFINTKNDSISHNILKTKKPNVILIIWEGLTAKVVEPLGGAANVTENFNKLTEEGLLFTNFYANGDRTDKGLVAILSGYYPQPNKSIIKTPSKTQSLPMLSKKMKDIGYTTSFYYGGDTNFGNMNTYFRNGGITDIIDGDEFDRDDWNSKWGTHDHILLNRVTADLSKKQSEPFFKIILTLSSHEPFEFPDEDKFGNDTKDNQFKSSHAYTDKAVGKFIEESKKQSWWNNTLVVIMADHGNRLPVHEGAFNSPKKFHIPMLWIGGALAKTNSVNDNISSQKDFAYSLLNLLDGDTDDFEWSQDIFINSPNDYAHYVFNRGFGTVKKDGAFVYDYVSNKMILSEGNSKTNLEELGKATTQKAYDDYIER